MKEPIYPTGHFYSSIPNTDELDFSKWEKPFSHLINFDDEQYLSLIKQISIFVSELNDIETSTVDRFCWDNPMYPPADAILYYGMIRYFKPSHIIEIGAGYSSLIARWALAQNQTGALICIEPYPPSWLKDAHSIHLVENKAQCVSMEVFDQLQSGDILFVDSSHQCKTQSDVNFILFNVLPQLNTGVYIHFHDVFLPDEYPAFWLYDRGLFFNEQYILLAFLYKNDCYEIIFPTSHFLAHHERLFISETRHVYEKYPNCFRRNIPGTPNIIKGGSFWIRKVK